MKTLKILLVITLASLSACSNGKKNKNITSITSEILKDNDGLKLIQQNCYACHSVTSKSHDEIIAPPMVAIKRRYKRSYSTEEEFVTALTDWVLDPIEENALMFGAVQNFKVMPKQPLNKEEVTKIAIFMFNNELEKPSWFENHFNKEHPNGMGKGNGRGIGRLKNN